MPFTLKMGRIYSRILRIILFFTFFYFLHQKGRKNFSFCASSLAIFFFCAIFWPYFPYFTKTGTVRCSLNENPDRTMFGKNKPGPPENR